MHTAPGPQSESCMQLMSGTHCPVKKSHVVPGGQSAVRVQPVGDGTHIPFEHTLPGGHATPAHGSGMSGMHLPPMHVEFGGQSAFDMQPVTGGTHIPLMHVSPGGHGRPALQPALPGTQNPNTH